MARKKTLGMASLTKKHFVGIADILCAYDASDGMVSAFADYFGRANKQFRRDQFVAHVDRCKRGFDEHGVPYIDKRGRARR